VLSEPNDNFKCYQPYQPDEVRFKKMLLPPAISLNAVLNEPYAKFQNFTVVISACFIFTACNAKTQKTILPRNRFLVVWLSGLFAVTSAELIFFRDYR
jgi:hypothetical protein